MEFIGILFALFFALIITAIFSFVFRRTGPWSGFWVFFILLFFISLGAGEWAAPRGPIAWGYYWAPGLIAALIFALALAAATPPSRSSPRLSLVLLPVRKTAGIIFMNYYHFRLSKYRNHAT